jgi:hypothetical protein
MKHIIIFLLTFISFILSAAEPPIRYPIIFVHGHKSEAIPEVPEDKEKGGLKTWYPTEADGITLNIIPQ